MKVGNLVKVLPTLDVDSNFKEAAELFKHSDSDTAVVLENQKPVGIFSAFEALEKKVEGAKLKDHQIKQSMNHNILIIPADTDATDAAKTMLTHKHWIAVVTEKGEYRGVVTAGDLVKVLI